MREAGHYFATYDDNSNILRLDNSLLYCPGAAGLGAGASLVQTFIRRGGRYVLSRPGDSHLRGLHGKTRLD